METTGNASQQRYEERDRRITNSRCELGQAAKAAPVLLEQLGELAEHVKAFRVERVAGMEHAHVLQDFARARVRSLGRAHAPVHEHAPASNGASACAHGLVVTAADGDRASTFPGLPGLPAARRYSAS